MGRRASKPAPSTLRPTAQAADADERRSTINRETTSARTPSQQRADPQRQRSGRDRAAGGACATRPHRDPIASPRSSSPIRLPTQLAPPPARAHVIAAAHRPTGRLGAVRSAFAPGTRESGWSGPRRFGRGGRAAAAVACPLPPARATVELLLVFLCSRGTSELGRAPPFLGGHVCPLARRQLSIDLLPRRLCPRDRALRTAAVRSPRCPPPWRSRAPRPAAPPGRRATARASRPARACIRCPSCALPARRLAPSVAPRRESPDHPRSLPADDPCAPATSRHAA